VPQVVEVGVVILPVVDEDPTRGVAEIRGIDLEGRCGGENGHEQKVPSADACVLHRQNPK
jgi:hypothetical protein